MKKMFFCFSAIVMISSASFANTIEIKEDKCLEYNSSTKDSAPEKDAALTICYERSRSTSIHPSGVAITTTTWDCFNHPEMPGRGTVYIPASN